MPALVKLLTNAMMIRMKMIVAMTAKMTMMLMLTLRCMRMG